MTNKKYNKLLGQGNAEIFAQFFMRINQEIEGCALAEFSTLKILQGQHFNDFRNNFHARLEKIFVVPADTFDNVKGKFPIGFMIWDLSKKELFNDVIADVYDKNGFFISTKHIIANANDNFINEWIKPYRANKKDTNIIGKFPFKGNDFQNQNMIAIVHQNMVYNKEAGQFLINSNNLKKASIYYAVRHCIEATWLNDRDQFLFPNEGWQNDHEFQNDCLAYTLFNTNIQSKFGTNHWIPFGESEVNAKEKFESNFMHHYLQGKIKQEPKTDDLFSSSVVSPSTACHSEQSEESQTINQPLQFSQTAQAVFAAGRELWSYYHQNIPNGAPPSGAGGLNASLYDIREYFQGRNDKGKMNHKSHDETYMKLITNLRESLKTIAKKIEPKVYQYGFLKE